MRSAIAAMLAAGAALACASPGGGAMKVNENAPEGAASAVEPAAPEPGAGVPLPPFAHGREIALPAPRKGWGPPLMAALAQRRSSRSFDPARDLDQRLLADLLWAATGVNREQTGQRTAPTARDRRDLDVYLATARGLYRYAPERHALLPIAPDDLRPLTGMQDFAATAPLDLVYVSDLAEIAGESREDKILYAGAHAGFVAQNVYLFCAAAGLATVVRAYVDKPRLAAAMGLAPDGQLIALAQTVGFPGPAAAAD